MDARYGRIPGCHESGGNAEGSDGKIEDEGEVLVAARRRLLKMNQSESKGEEYTDDQLLNQMDKDPVFNLYGQLLGMDKIHKDFPQARALDFTELEMSSLSENGPESESKRRVRRYLQLQKAKQMMKRSPVILNTDPRTW